MQENYSTIKKNRKLQRFIRFIFVYFMLWFVFRAAIVAFRGNLITAAFGEIVLTGIIFSVVLGFYSLYKKQVMYISGKSKSDAIKWLSDNDFVKAKQINDKTLRYIRPKKERFGTHEEVIVRVLEDLVELECDINSAKIIFKKLENILK